MSQQRTPLDPRPEPHDHDNPKTFQDEFMQIMETLAKHMLEDFASDARSHGYPGEVESGRDSSGNPFAKVRFVLDRTAQLDVDKTNECEFLFKGMLADEKIEITAAFDQRPGKDGVRHEKLEIQMINQLALENQLTDFLAAALASRKDQPIPPPRSKEVAAPAPAAAASAPIPIIWKSRSK